MPRNEEDRHLNYESNRERNYQYNNYNRGDYSHRDRKNNNNRQYQRRNNNNRRDNYNRKASPNNSCSRNKRDNSKDSCNKDDNMIVNDEKVSYTVEHNRINFHYETDNNNTDQKEKESACASISILNVIYKKALETPRSSSLSFDIEKVLDNFKRIYRLFIEMNLVIGKSSYSDEEKESYKDLMETFLNFTRRIILYSGCGYDNKVQCVRGTSKRVIDLFVKECSDMYMEILHEPLASISAKLNIVSEQVVESLGLFRINNHLPFLDDISNRLSLLDKLFVESAKKLMNQIKHLERSMLRNVYPMQGTVLGKRQILIEASHGEDQLSYCPPTAENQQLTSNHKDSNTKPDKISANKDQSIPTEAAPKLNINNDIKNSKHNMGREDHPVPNTSTAQLLEANVEEKSRPDDKMSQRKPTDITEIERFISKYTPPVIKICAGKQFNRIFNHPYYLDPAHKSLHEEKMKESLSITKLNYYCTLKKVKNTSKRDLRCSFCGMESDWYNNTNFDDMQKEHPHLFNNNIALFFNRNGEIQATYYSCEDCKVDICVWCYALL